MITVSLSRPAPASACFYIKHKVLIIETIKETLTDFYSSIFTGSCKTVTCAQHLESNFCEHMQMCFTSCHTSEKINSSQSVWLDPSTPVLMFWQEMRMWCVRFPNLCTFFIFFHCSQKFCLACIDLWAQPRCLHIPVSLYIHVLHIFDPQKKLSLKRSSKKIYNVLWAVMKSMNIKHLQRHGVDDLCSSLCLHSFFSDPSADISLCPYGTLCTSNINVVPTENGRSKKRDDLLPTFSPKGTVFGKTWERDV